MPNKMINREPVSRFMREISLSILMPFFSKSDREPAHLTKCTSSVFSQPDPYEQLANEEDVCPLVEAEVYVIFGRRADAEEALAAGVKAGRITADQAVRFWSEQSKSSRKTATD